VLETLGLKIDALTETMRSSLDVNREMMYELKQTNNSFQMQFSHLREEISRLERGIDTNTAEDRKMRERLEEIEKRCAAREVLIPVSSRCGERPDMEAWWAKKVVRWSVVVGGPVLTFAATKLAERLL
jgi:predicted nuclease with TOPRIM domain